MGLLPQEMLKKTEKTETRIKSIEDIFFIIFTFQNRYNNIKIKNIKFFGMVMLHYTTTFSHPRDNAIFHHLGVINHAPTKWWIFATF